MLSRVAPSSFIEPCLPSSAGKPPSSPEWVHETKHDGYRLMARRDTSGVRLLTRNAHDWAPRYPLIVEALARLRSRSCIIDGEAVCCGDDGVPSFDRIRYRRHDASVVAYLFYLKDSDRFMPIAPTTFDARFPIWGSR
jgi:bifunctional non-homologous end joining protein LigD